MFIHGMHNAAHIFSLEQKSPKQLVCLMFIYKGRHDNIRRVHACNTRAANVYSFPSHRIIPTIMAHFYGMDY